MFEIASLYKIAAEPHAALVRAHHGESPTGLAFVAEHTEITEHSDLPSSIFYL
jgi:hypothetical protein